MLLDTYFKYLAYDAAVFIHAQALHNHNLEC